MSTAVLLLSTPVDNAHKGVVAAITQFLVTHNGRILHADDHVDSGRAMFLSRLEWDLARFDIPVSDFERYFNPLAEQYKIKYHLALTDHRPKVVILVSGYDHCLADLLYRHGTGELACDIVTIIRSEDKAKPLADFHGISFHLLTSPQDKRKCEQEMMDLIGQDIDLSCWRDTCRFWDPSLLATTCCGRSMSIIHFCRRSLAQSRTTKLLTAGSN